MRGIEFAGIGRGVPNEFYSELLCPFRTIRLFCLTFIQYLLKVSIEDSYLVYYVDILNLI